MGATRKSVPHIFDECEDCKYRNQTECTYIRLHSNRSDVNSRPVWKRKTKKFVCPKVEREDEE